MADLKITERTTMAYQKFMEEAGKHVRKIRNEWQLEEFHESCNQEYMKLFGRIGMRPLEHIRGGKPRPRYLIDRDEVWVIYKPPLWQMGGDPKTWTPQLKREYIQKCSGRAEALEKMRTDKKSIMQMYHGLACGFNWVGDEEPEDEQSRYIKDWGFIQRLDIETDGPVIVAKTWRAQRFLQVQLKEHIFSKAYLCLVHGKVENRVQFMEGKFAALGGGGEAAIMVKHDREKDPFYTKYQQGWWKHRDVRQAKTFFKPLAYYKRPSDGSEYTLVYVNILSGITHQVRITMQSVGHPLVADDRYLPTKEALEDADWCPRNFLVEVRSDWFDMCGPYEDRKRRAYTRISMENPLPKLFQDILEKKLTLTEKLDTTADLNLGCTYWALGDEMLMTDHPKDNEYRKKVIRWGVRRGIHLDAMDRLLLLSREDIDRVIAEYKPPSEDEDNWVCTQCMSLNQSNAWGDGQKCKGYIKTACTATLKMPRDTKLPYGWRDYLADPTLHMLKKVNPLWLEARRVAIQKRRAVWERAPQEEDNGDFATEEQTQRIFEALVQDAKHGGYGIEQKDLTARVKGLDDLKIPIRIRQEYEHQVRRVRLPGRGIGSAWTYTLSGKERLKAASDFSCQPKFLREPLLVETDMFPQKNIASEEDLQNMQVADGMESIEEVAASNKRKRWESDDQRNEQRKDDAKETRKSQHENWQARRESTGSAAKQPRVKEKRPGNWQRMVKSDKTVYYMDVDTGETRNDMPPDYKERPPVWERVASRSNPGHVYYHNTETRETRIERPQGVKILNDEGPLPPASELDAQKEEEGGIPWERIESKSKPGLVYYFNPLNGENEIKPPRVKAPWQLLESTSNKGQYYYFNQETGESTEIPPRCALPHKALAGQPSPVRSSATLAPAPSSRPGALRTSSAPSHEEREDEHGPLPDPWVRCPSSTYRNKFFYRNTKTEETRWERPSAPPPPALPPAGEQWERVASSTYSGKFYYRNTVTGETKWETR